MAMVRSALSVLFLALGTASCATGPHPASAVSPAAEASLKDCLTGAYEGSAPEIAAALELGGDGRFRYALTYGALDESAAGAWRSKDGRVVLTSDPVIPPAFALLTDEPAPDGLWSIKLDVPGAISRQYFDAEFEFADGSAETHQFAEDGLTLDFPEDGVPVQVRLLLPLFGVASDNHPLRAQGARMLRFRFDPNDIGKVAFRGEVLEVTEHTLTFERHGRRLELIRSEAQCESR